jgi:hypothetical protein
LGRAVNGHRDSLLEVQSVSGGTPRWYGGVQGAAVSPETFDPDVGKVAQTRQTAQDPQRAGNLFAFYEIEQVRMGRWLHAN